MSESTVDPKLLQGAPFFARLSSEDLEGILRVGVSVSFAPGEAIVEQGDVGDGMYVLTEGVAEVDVGGRFHRLKPGDFFGEMALVSAGKRIATVKAVEPVEALKIPPTGSARSWRLIRRWPCLCSRPSLTASGRSNNGSTPGWPPNGRRDAEGR